MFSAGVFLAVAATHLLPEVLEFEGMSKLKTEFPVGFALFVTGYVMLMFFENAIFPSHDHGVDSTPVDEVSAKSVTGRYMKPMIMQGALLIHAVLEAMALGLTVRLSYTRIFLVHSMTLPTT